MSLSLSTTTSSSLGTTHMNNTVGGLDVDALVSATIQSASLPMISLQNKNTKLQAQMNDYNTIKTALGTLQYAATDLTYASTFSAMKATSSDEKIVTASSQNGGTSGSYVINVGATATITSNTSAILGNAARKANVAGTQVYDSGTPVTDGVLTINGIPIGVTALDSLTTIVNHINSSAAGVTASVGTDGKVSITQKTAGPTITLTDTSGFLTNAGILQANVTAGNADTSGGIKAYVTGTGNAADIPTYNTALNETGTFSINGKSIAVTKDDTVNTIVNKITASGAGVTASVGTDGKVTIKQNTAGLTPTIQITDSSTLLGPLGLTGATVNPGVNSDETRTLDDLFGTAAGATSGYFSINGTFFNVDSTKDTIDSIINKINTSTTVGVSAFYNSNTGMISLTSQTAGAKDIKLGTGATDSSDFLSKIGLAQGNQKTGTEASVTVNGVSVTPVNNKVTFNGNTFTLTGTGTATVSVQSDVDSIVAKVQTFITAYNAAIDAVYNKLNEGSGKDLNSSTDPSVGDLFGDPTLATINNKLRGIASTVVTNQVSSMQQLSQVGITTGAPGVFDSAKVQSGHLELDTTKLKSALQSDIQSVTSLFGNTLTSVTNETVTQSGGVYSLKNGSITGDVTIKVGTQTYTQVSGTPKAHTADPTDLTKTTGYEYSVDYTTGKITFGSDPASDFPGDTISADYKYDISSGSNAGIFVQMQTMLNDNTKYGGQFDAITGSNGSITKTMKYNNDRISDLKTRLAAQQATLYTKYQNMQTLLASIQSQGSYMTSMLASLNSSSK
ncbi:flagellar filament capping protein FliD [Pelosinus sp. UFO1]|uniref:flagellar filament capping protein FliD n=1 Tax=Pelosinus sp. UFO1 TaxID=484770 RepID=UPI0004D14706|nr:flagellar filament capping protein FliD [Pelosinus sp. UFO1]AIF53653.1 flagellar hook-associated 2 domain-containing protein [Pelosinus sp. UFO1]